MEQGGGMATNSPIGSRQQTTCVYRKRKILSEPMQSVDSSNSEIVSIAGKRVVVVKLRDELESGTENCPENKETNDVKAKKCAKANPVAKNGEARLLSLTKDGLITLNVISKAPTANPSIREKKTIQSQGHSAASKLVVKPEYHKKAFDCKRCLKVFITKDLYTKHVLKVPPFLLPCKYCSRTFESICRLEVHEFTHAISELHCLQCEVPFPKAGLLQHFKKCPNAIYKMDSKLYSALHRVQMQAKTDLIEKTKVKAIASFKVFNCPLCSFSSTLNEVLVTHIQDCKSRSNQENNSLVCSACGFSTRHRYRFRTHFMHTLSTGKCIVEKSDPSDPSPKEEPGYLDWTEFGDLQMKGNSSVTIINNPPKTELVNKQTIKLVGPNIQPSIFQCQHCFKSYSSKMNLEEHVAIDCTVRVAVVKPIAKNADILNFSCRFCSNILQSMKSLMNHEIGCTINKGVAKNFAVCIKCRSVMENVLQCPAHSVKCILSCQLRTSKSDVKDVIEIKDDDEFVLS